MILQINRHKSCILIFCTYSWMQAPDRREIYYPPQIIYGLDGDQSVLFGTGGSERSGALYVISMTDLLERDVSRVWSLPIVCNLSGLAGYDKKIRKLQPNTKMEFFNF